ncbi:MAG: hypothetical protein MAG453_00985 [Calditrichaeota bacterium]|nr:hypothetical protein [Calditrichota bacterium]
MPTRSEKPSTGHRVLMIALFTATIVSVVSIAVSGRDYYAAPRSERPHMEQHGDWKSGGEIGHGLGMIGSLLMLLMLLYIPRKRMRALQNIGKLSHWLDIHIWMGVTGPLLITFHSTFKFGGIVSISYWSMVAVGLSGVLGRYIYLQIPRSLSGQELSERELDAMDEHWAKQMRELPGVSDALVAEVTGALTAGGRELARGLGAVFAWIAQDLTRPFRTRALLRRLRRETGVERELLREIVALARRRALLTRRRAFLTVAHNTLHHWHVIHRPFALVMFIIMFIHIGVAIVFGYTWIL